MAKIHESFFGKLLENIGKLFHSASQKLWNSLTPEEQAALKHGSGVISIINKHLTDLPEVIIAEIQTEFPDIDLAVLEQALINVCKALGVTPFNLNIDGAIKSIQLWLSSKEDNKIWEWASSAATELVTVALMPDTMVFQKVSILIQWVYDTFIKKS